MRRTRPLQNQPLANPSPGTRPRAAAGVLALLLLLLAAGCASPVAAPVNPGGPPTPTVRPGLQASDPDAFVRATGSPQFVEFFAFW